MLHSGTTHTSTSPALFLSFLHFSHLFYSQIFAMSSLRLALKQSLQESGGLALKKPKERKPRPPSNQVSNVSTSSNTNSNNLPLRRKRRPGDPPRKRGRPRKHPLPELPKDEKEEEEETHIGDSQNDQVDNSSDENEFSDSDSFEETGDESEQTNHRKDHYKDDADDEAHEDDHGEDRSTMDHDEIAARKKQRKLLKKMKQQDLAANTIQRKLSEWTKSKVVARSMLRPISPKHPKKSQTGEQPEYLSSMETKPRRSAKGIVPAPAPEIIDWISSMSIKKQRRNMSAGLRVKVRFATKVKKRDGKIVSKHKWYGGLVTAMSSGGSKIRIKYDDSTVEVAKYPDADIIVDDEENAIHQAPADAFIPPLQSDNDENNLEDSPDAALKSTIPDTTPRPADGEVPDDWKSENKWLPSPRPESFNNKPQRTRDAELTDDAATQDGTLSADGHAQEGVDDGGENTKVPYEVSGRVENATAIQDTHMEDNGSKADSDDDDVEEEIGGKDAPRIMRERETSNCTASADDKILHPSDCQDNTDESSDDYGPMEIIAEGTGADVVVSVPTDETSGEEDGISEPAEVEEIGGGFQVYASRQSSFSPTAKGRTPEGEHESRVDADDGAVSDDETVDEQNEGDSQRLLTQKNGRSYDDEDDGDEGEDAMSEAKGSSIDDERETASQLHENMCDNNPRPYKRKKETNDEEVISRSSTPRELSTPKTKRESPLIILSEFKKDSLPRELTKPVSKVARKVEASAQGDALKPDSPPIGLSQNSAFDKKEKPFKEKREKQAKESNQAVDEDVYSLTPNRDSGDLSLLQRSGRRAAQQANERIASRQELIIAETISKPKKRKIMVEKPESKPPGKKRKDSEHGVDGTDENQWVQCDLCAKWRVLPSTVDVDKLPNKWFCEMNIYDPQHNSCDATEQTPEEVAKAKRKAKRRLVRRARLEAEAAATAAASLADTVAVEPEEKEIEKEDVKPKATKSPAPEKRKREEKPVEEVKKLETPPLNQSDEEGKISSGSYSDSDQKDAKKARRARGDDGLVEVSDGVKGKVRGRIRRGKDGKDEKTKGRKGSNKGKDDSQEWVQCEKCEKWRRLPPNISADDLPEVWYCTMNTWDPNTATCGAAEDKADPSSHIVPGFGVQGGHKLSYRSLIFGTGKKQHRPISERMRAAESLFSSHAFADPDTVGSHPTVMYANSSMFVNRSNAARAAEERNGDRKTFLEAMSHSNLWAELRGRNRRLNEQAACREEWQNGTGLAAIAFSTLPDDAKQSMKEMVFYALASSTMTSHEVLLETQCRLWEGVPQTWTELRAICTIDMVVACLLELVKDGRIEAVQSTSPHRTVLEVMPTYRRVAAFTHIPALKAEEEHLPATRLMKIAKPWKHGLSY